MDHGRFVRGMNDLYRHNIRTNAAPDEMTLYCSSHTQPSFLPKVGIIEEHSQREGVGPTRFHVG